MSKLYNQGTEAFKDILKDSAGKNFTIIDGSGNPLDVVNSDYLSSMFTNDLFESVSYIGQRTFKTGAYANGKLTSDDGTAFLASSLGPSIRLSIVDNGNGSYNVVQGAPKVDSNGNLTGEYIGAVKSDLTAEELLATILAAYDVGIDSQFWDYAGTLPQTREVIEYLQNEIDNGNVMTGVEETEDLTANGVQRKKNITGYASINAHAKVLNWLQNLAQETGHIEENYAPLSLDNVVMTSAEDSPNIRLVYMEAGSYTFDEFRIPASGNGYIRRVKLTSTDNFFWYRGTDASYNTPTTTMRFLDLMIARSNCFTIETSSVVFSSSSYDNYIDAVAHYDNDLNNSLVDNTDTNIHDDNSIYWYGHWSDISWTASQIFTTITDLYNFRNSLLQSYDTTYPKQSVYSRFLENLNYVGDIVLMFLNNIISPNDIVSAFKNQNITEDDVINDNNLQGIHGNDTIQKLQDDDTNPFEDFVSNLNKDFSDWLSTINGLNLNTYYGDEAVAGQDDSEENPEDYPYPTYIPTPIITPWNDPETNPEQDPAKRRNPTTHNPTNPNSNLDPAINPSINRAPTPEQEKRQNKKIENDISPSADPTDDTPTDNTPPNSGIITPSSTPTVEASAMFSVHKPSASQLSAFASYLWSSNFIDNLLKMFSDPMQAIVSLHQLYVNPSTGSSTNIICGYLDSGVSAPKVTSQFATINCGSIKVPKYYNNVMDNAPYTDLQLYLPFVGFVKLSNAECMGATLTITYKVDVYSGQCVAHIKVVKDGLSAVLYQYGGNCAVQLPYSGGNWSQFVQAGIGIIGAGVATALTGGAAAPAIAGGVMSLASADTQIARGGSFGQSVGALSHKKPYLIIDRKNAHGALYQPFGYGDNTYTKLSSCSGYVRIKEVNLSGIQATAEELSAIEQMLKEGVIV